MSTGSSSRWLNPTDEKPPSISLRDRSLRLAGGSLSLALLGGLVGVWSGASTRRIALVAERSPQAAWAACNRNAGKRRASTFTPAPDHEAAKLVTHQKEVRALNARPYAVNGRLYPAANFYVPSAPELARFRRSETSAGQPVLQFNPYFRYVDGRDAMSRPSTDDLIQWAAHKWGVPENWLRAEFVQESFWNQFQEGDAAQVSRRWYALYPSQSRAPGARKVYESLGVTQIKWRPDGSVGPGSEPLRWRSTAFALDYQAAMVRFYYDDPGGGRSSWGDRSYRACQPWYSIGGWFEPYPWGNKGQRLYVAEVRGHLAARSWTTASFVRWSPGALPMGITMR